MFLKRISETNNNDKPKTANIFKGCWMSKKGTGSPNSDNVGQEGEGIKKSNILPDVL